MLPCPLTFALVKLNYIYCVFLYLTSVIVKPQFQTGRSRYRIFEMHHATNIIYNVKYHCSRLLFFRCVRQERISIKGSVRSSVRLSVGPSVGRSVRPSRLCKNRVSRLFLATVRSYTETNDQPTCFESLFTRLFVHLSLHTYVT